MSIYMDTLRDGLAKELGDDFLVEIIAQSTHPDLVVEHLPTRTEIPAGTHTLAHTRHNTQYWMCVPGDKRKRATAEDIQRAVEYFRRKWAAQAGPICVQWARDAAKAALADFPEVKHDVPAAV